MDFQKVIEKRASVRRYSSEVPAIEDIIKMLDSANLAPSPGNRAIGIYILVEEYEQRQKLAKACQQDFVGKAPYVIVVCSNPKQTKALYEKRADRYVKQQIGAAIENMLLKAVDLGLVACWVGAFSEPTIKNLLTIPYEIDVEAVIPVGSKLVTDKTTQRRKPRLQGRIFYGRFKNKFRRPLRSAYAT